MAIYLTQYLSKLQGHKSKEVWLPSPQKKSQGRLINAMGFLNEIPGLERMLSKAKEI